MCINRLKNKCKTFRFAKLADCCLKLDFQTYNGHRRHQSPQRHSTAKPGTSNIFSSASGTYDIFSFSTFGLFHSFLLLSWTWMNNAEEVTKSRSALDDDIMRREIIGFHKYFLYYAIIYSKMVLGELDRFLFLLEFTLWKPYILVLVSLWFLIIIYSFMTCLHRQTYSDIMKYQTAAKWFSSYVCNIGMSTFMLIEIANVRQ